MRYYNIIGAMRTSDFYYDLPKELIAQAPAHVRSGSRLLVYNRNEKRYSDEHFNDIVKHINPGDIIVRNNTKVIPARIFGKREQTGGVMEFLLLKRLDKYHWEALVRPGRRAKEGNEYIICDELKATIGKKTDSDGRIIEFAYDGIFEEILDRVGEMPLPPYITKRLAEKERYQTVYAKEDGSAAAPTAGLHFTNALFDELRDKGVIIVDILLHVGLGTFRPVAVEDISQHKMHSEYYEVTQEAADTINAGRAKGGRIICVGTTSTRTLESVADDEGIIHAGSGNTDIFITPGYKFKAVDALITNFHLPESTLLMLVSALCSRDEIMMLYKHAIEEKYRFFSFGDAMFIE